MKIINKEQIKYLVPRFYEFVKIFPKKDFFVWVNIKCTEKEKYTYVEFQKKSENIAYHLLSKGIKRGDNVVLAYTPSADFYLAFWACLISGIIPVPITPPFSDSDFKKFFKIVKNSEAKYVLRDTLFERLVLKTALKYKINRFKKGVSSTIFGAEDNQDKTNYALEIDSINWITTSNLPNKVFSEKLRPQEINKPAFIMYSSGSTSDPKGSLTTFENLEHQLSMNDLALEGGVELVSCWWAPHFHDYGLISGFMNVIHQGGTGIVTSPMYFIQNPALWLDMISKYKGTHTFGPDFAYQLLIKKTKLDDCLNGKWDLKTLKVAMTAAEKVRLSTINSFYEKFKNCGFKYRSFCPAYGLAEHAVGVTINDLHKELNTLTVYREPLESEGRVIEVVKGKEKNVDDRILEFVGCGTVWHGIDVKIVKVNTEGVAINTLSNDRVGEIWVSSPSVAIGYYKMPQLSKEVFNVTLPGSSNFDNRTYLRTGDLGFISSSDNELYICGRIKDMVIIAGKNYYSEDIELSISLKTKNFLRAGRIAAIAVEDPNTEEEQLVIVAEVKNSNLDPNLAFTKLKELIAAEFKINIYAIALIKKQSIAKTSSGKLRRFLVKEQFKNGTLRIIPNGFWQGQVQIKKISNQKESDLIVDVKSKITPKKLVDSDFSNLLLDFNNFVSRVPSPGAFRVYFAECGKGYDEWIYLTGPENFSLVFDEDMFYRMPVWNFTGVNAQIFNENNFSRWANGEIHKKLKGRLIELIDNSNKGVLKSTLDITRNYGEKWKVQKEFSWFPQLDSFVAEMYCKIFIGQSVPQSHELFRDVLFGVDPFRRRSLLNTEVVRENADEEGLLAKEKLSKYIPNHKDPLEQKLISDLIISMGCFAALPALKTTISNFIAHISSEPSIKTTLLNELKTLDLPYDQNQIESLKFLEACIFETIRLHPPVGHIYVRAKQSMEISGLKVSEGDNIVVNTWYTNRDPRYFDNPNIFDPYRFLPPRNEHLHKDKPFMPFGIGNVNEGRACPGKEMAMTIVKTVATTLFLEYDWNIAQPAWWNTNFRDRYGCPNFEDGLKVGSFSSKSTNDYESLKSFNLEKLSKYNGNDNSKPIYIALLGNVYDVSTSYNFYGAGGPYHLFAGKDASRGLAKMSFSDDDLSDQNLNDLTDKEIEVLNNWEHKFKEKYPIVGTLIKTEEKYDHHSVAIVGAGVSGLSAALALSSRGYNVSVFEKKSIIGGHACSVKVFDKYQRAPAFGSFMENQWPNACKIMDLIGAEKILECIDFDGFYSKKDPICHFARDGHKFSYKHLEEEANKFYLDMLTALKDSASDGKSIGDYFEEENYSREFICNYFVGRVIHYFAGHSIEYYLNYPLRLVAWMFVGITAEIEADSDIYRLNNKQYMDCFRQHLENHGVQFYLSESPIVKSRSDEGFCLQFDRQKMLFSNLILAIQPHHAIKVLNGFASSEELNLLSQFEFTTDTVVLHRDRTWLPTTPKDATLLNFLLPDKYLDLPTNKETIPVSTSFVCDNDGVTPIIATYFYSEASNWKGNEPYEKFTFEHLKVTPKTQMLRKQIKELLPNNRLQLCGSWLRGLTLHEDAVVSGIEAANRILHPQRRYPLIKARVPLPEPFEDLSTSDKKRTNPRTQEDIIRQLNIMLNDLQYTEDDISAETEIQSLGLSSLDGARFVNEINEKLGGEGLSMELLLSIENFDQLSAEILNRIGESDNEIIKEVPSLEAVISSANNWEMDNEYFDVSFSQRPILTNHFVGMQKSSEWNIPTRLWLIGNVSVETLKAAILKLIDRHSVLRSKFYINNVGDFNQIIQKTVSNEFFQLYNVATDEEAIALAEKLCKTPIDVKTEVLKAALINAGNNKHLFVIVLHHCVSDGWSIGMMIREIALLYNGIKNKVPIDKMGLPELKIQFVDFIHWQKNCYNAGFYSEAISYWRKQLSAPLPFLRMQEKTGLSGERSNLADSYEFTITKGTLEALKSLSRTLKTSLNVIILTAYAEILSKLVNQKEILIHVPFAARTKQTEDLIGCFAEAMVLRLPVGGKGTFKESVINVHDILYKSLEYSIPFSIVSESIDIDDDDRSKMHFAVLNWEQTISLKQNRTIEIEGLTTEFLNVNKGGVTEIPRFSQSILNINETKNGMDGEWQFKKDVFNSITMRRLIDGFVNLLETSSFNLADVNIKDILVDSSKDHNFDLELRSFSSKELFKKI
ncbi:MAG: cytochrome P450 [Saprospiraceae bacterium]|nr:cytochrome P450 [Saprospiraceae bacterium]